MEPANPWDAGAAAWLHFVRSGGDYYRLLVHGPALREACGDVAGRDALDLGCGEGYFTRQLARGGARATGVDLSAELLRAAREEEMRAPLDIDYTYLDAREIAGRWPPASFDLVTACMALQDMADAGNVFDGIAHVLRRGGRLVFSVPHPCTDMAVREWERDAAGDKVVLRVDRYFDTGPGMMHWNMPRLQYHWHTPHWRRTLQEWTALTQRAGLVIRRLLEPRPSAEQVRAEPRLDDCARLPYFLIFDCMTATS